MKKVKEEIKHCGKCEHDLSLDKFWRNWGTRDGYQAYCIDCLKSQHAEIRQRNREENSKKGKSYGKISHRTKQSTSAGTTQGVK